MRLHCRRGVRTPVGEAQTAGGDDEEVIAPLRPRRQ